MDRSATARLVPVQDGLPVGEPPFDYGLAGQVSSGDDEHALAVALKLHTGTVGANVGGTFSLTSPLGGVRQSGLGRRYGDHGFEEYLGVKAIGLPA